MRRTVFAALLASAVIGMIMSGCDLLDKEVLIDEGVKTVVNDSTTIPVMSSVPDSAELVINSGSDWHADVAKGGDWCTLSKHDGTKGCDTIYIHVEENSGTQARQTSIVVESATMIMVFKVQQIAGELWHDMTYWKRTVTQRLGLHGMPEQMTITDNRRSTESSIYKFDRRGNLLEHKYVDKVANRYDTTRTYTYDEADHRLTCTVKADATGTVVRKWRYEYGNAGKFVAASAKGWMDPDPLSESLEGMIVPDLSASCLTLIDGADETHIDTRYLFDGDSRLLIVEEKWVQDGSGDKITLKCDTSRVSYQYFNNCRMMLPYTSRGYVTNCGYYANGMLKMLRTAVDAYDFVDNSQRMLVASYSFVGTDEPHEIDFYECDYNANHDLIEKRTRYSGATGVTVEKYPQYQYDAQHNWAARVEELMRPGYTEPLQNATKREIVYFRNN